MAYRRTAGRAGADVVPALAARMPDVSADGRHLSFALRADARFGPPPTAPSARATSRRASSASSWRARPGASSTAPSAAPPPSKPHRRRRASPASRPTTTPAWLEIALTRSDPAILRVLALPFAFVLPKGHAPTDQSQVATASARPLPGGRLHAGRRDRPGAQPRLRPGRGGPREPGPAAIHVDLGVSSDDALRRVAAGQADYVQTRPSPAQIRAAAADPADRVWRHVEGATYYFFMNTTRAPFSDIRVRRGEPRDRPPGRWRAPSAARRCPPPRCCPRRAGRRQIDPPPLRTSPARTRSVARAGRRGAAVSVWARRATPPAVTRLLERTLDRIGLHAAPRLWDRSTMLADPPRPRRPSQIGYARWQQDYPDGADWFPLLLAVRPSRRGQPQLLAARRRG